MRGGEITVSEPPLEDRLGHPPVQRSAFRLLVLFVPAEAEPLQALKNRVHRGICVPLDVGVIKSQDHGSAIPAGIQPVKYESSCAAHMEKAGG